MANVNELQEFLFETLKGIKDGSVNVDKAKAIAGVSNVLVSSAKVEVEYAKALGAKANSAFLNRGDAIQPARAITANGGVVERDGAVTRHTTK